MTDPDTPFPTLMLDAPVSAWSWPAPPFGHSRAMAPLPEGVEPCRIETLTGAAVTGELVEFAATALMLRFRIRPDSDPVSLGFDKIRSLTLTTPWPLVAVTAGAPIERVPSAAQERDYRVDLASGGQLTGRTLGHVQQVMGLFLFVPHDDATAVLRVFVPQQACAAVSFGASIEEQAAERWIATPEQLLAALEAQQRRPMRPLGEALLELGLVTPNVLERVAREQGATRQQPLGELLVAAGRLTRADLQTALAYKMGYPMVDLARFPIETEAVRLLPHQAVLEHRALPLMRHGERLIVAVDELSQIPHLQGLSALAQLKVVPVLASNASMVAALSTLAQRLGTDPWGHNVPAHLARLLG
jgi:hypothetical protein